MRTLFSAGTIDRIKLVSRQGERIRQKIATPLFDLTPIYRYNSSNLTISIIYFSFFVTEREREIRFITFCINDKGEEGIREIGGGIEDSSEVFRWFSLRIFARKKKKREKKRRTRWLDPLGKSAAGPGGACAAAPFTDTPRELDPTPPPPLVETAFLAFFPC